ncbi:L10-interacting MYB domain-containing protein-like isoform X1 [Phoenix dactylifera]|uniref:L10-interacting MYB domain-containing protein-like isoform X1 n=1 Tax=Phoenix dactylifera TaxID=42345 RepID=A0A8B9AV55_PHODC|nr:L10-interacting MYB domain-containing protein-like isoform X1 [Phoenix dactylifera]
MALFAATELGHLIPLPSVAPRNPRSTLFLCCHSPESSLISFSSSTRVAIRPAPSATAGCTRNGRPRCLTTMAAQNLAGSLSGAERLHLGVQNIAEGVDASQTACNQQTSPSTGSQQTCKKFKWNLEMSKFLLRFLVDQVAIGMKVGMSFKRSALVAAAESVSQKFKIKCDETDVEKRLRTLRTQWNKIQKLKCLSGASWDPVAKMISLGTGGYQDYVQAHPRDAWLLNNSIDYYDELAIICADDQAIGKFIEDGNQYIGSIDREIEEQHQKNMQWPDDIEEVAKASNSQVRGLCQQEPAVSTPAASPNSSPESRRRATSSRTKRQQAANVDIQSLVMKIGELIDVIKTLKPRNYSEDIWEAIKACGYNERLSVTALEYLLKNEIEGKIFLVRSPESRKEWLSKFFSSFL